MSRRKQTKPFKVEEKLVIKREKKPKLRNLLPKANENAHQSSFHNDANSGNSSDGDETGKRSRRGTKCEQCGKILASSLSLARHKLTHSENKPYQCPRCDAGFKTSSNMHRHLRIHFREVKDDETGIHKQPKTSFNQRTPRQNIRTPNKYKEFDVDLLGVGPRSNDNDAMITNARSYSKPKDSLVNLKQRQPITAKENDIMDVGVGTQMQLVNDENYINDDLPDLNSPRSASSKVPEDLACHLCHKTFISKFGLLTHAITHPEPNSATKCHLCDQNFSTHKGLTVHNVIVHKVGNSKEQRTLFKSGSRGFQDISMVDFSANKFPFVAEAACTTSHRGQPLQDTQHIFVCKKCDSAFPLLRSLKLHVINMHLKPKNNVPKKMEDFNFFSALNLRDNTTSVSTVFTEQNALCKVHHGVDDDFIYTSQSVVLEDIPVWLNEVPDFDMSSYKKEYDVSFIAPQLRHIRRKQSIDKSDNQLVKYNGSKDRNNSLRLQGKRKSRNYASPDTITKRFDDPSVDGDKLSGERNVFWCRICNYSSHEKSALVRHLLTHSGIRPYFCKICDYAFTTKANCERHVRKRHNCVERAELHAAVKCDLEMLKQAPKDDIYMISGSNSSCPVCNKSFSCNNDLRQHLKEHEEKQFICQLCNVKCTTRNNCVRHILYKHPGIPHQEANNIITVSGTRNRILNIRTTQSSAEETNIDIGRGHLGGRKSTKRNSQMLKPRTKPLSHGQPPSKKPKFISNEVTDSENNNIITDEDGIIPLSLPENDEWKKEQDKEQLRIIQLIPLLKIKAYSEAASKSYTDMVVFYQNLNFFNNNIVNDPLDDTITPLPQSQNKNQEDEMKVHIQEMETTFVCQSCSVTFDTEVHLTDHLLICNSNNKPDVDEMLNEERRLFPTEDSDNSWKNENDMVDEWFSLQSGQTTDWEESLTETPLNETESASILDETNSLSKSMDSSSHFGGKSMENMLGREYSLVGLDELKAQTAFNGLSKESSYVEDSLLMSMFGEGRKQRHINNEADFNNPANMEVSRYSSSFPTMVNMQSTTGARLRYQDRESKFNSSIDNSDDAVLGPNKGKYFTGRKCPQCEKTFPWASSLRRHIMTHTGLKLYMCRLCKMRFTTRSNLIRHVFRRHGMAKTHPEFSSCLAKLHPSDTLLREVEADVRRRVDGSKKNEISVIGIRNTEIENATIEDDETKDDDLQHVIRKKRGTASDFQSMLEDDPETLLVDLDYSPRDELNASEAKKLKISTLVKASPQKGDIQVPYESIHDSQCEADMSGIENVDGERDTAGSRKESEDVPIDMSLTQMSNDINIAEALQQADNDQPFEPHYHRGKNLRKRSVQGLLPSKSPAGAAEDSTHQARSKETKMENVSFSPSVPSRDSAKLKGRNKQSSQFVCGLCKKIFKTVPDLISHLDTHDVPHAWHCPVCGVPFTNKYNCQRHLTRRHGRSDLEPTYVEDTKHGPRNARGRPMKSAAGSPTRRKVP